MDSEIISPWTVLPVKIDRGFMPRNQSRIHDILTYSGNQGGCGQDSSLLGGVLHESLHSLGIADYLALHTAAKHDNQSEMYNIIGEIPQCELSVYQSELCSAHQA